MLAGRRSSTPLEWAWKNEFNKKKNTNPMQLPPGSTFFAERHLTYAYTPVYLPITHMCLHIPASKLATFTPRSFTHTHWTQPLLPLVGWAALESKTEMACYRKWYYHTLHYVTWLYNTVQHCLGPSARRRPHGHSGSQRESITSPRPHRHGGGR